MIVFLLLSVPVEKCVDSNLPSPFLALFCVSLDDDLPNYNGTLVDEAISLAQLYPNVYLEISAFLRKDENGEYLRPLAQINLQKVVDAGLADRVIYGSDVNQFPGGILPYMIAAIPSLIEAGFSDEDRCLALEGNSKKVFFKERTTGSATDAPASPVQTFSPVPSPTSAPTHSPTSSPNDCENTDNEFIVDSVVGWQRCGWLEENMMQYRYLCQFVDVAVTCPNTCSHCDLF